MVKVNGSRYEKDGWICIDIHGSPYERGYTMGYLLSKEIKDVMRMLDFLLMNTYGLPRIFFSDVISELFRNQIKERFKLKKGSKGGPLRSSPYWHPGHCIESCLSNMHCKKRSSLFSQWNKHPPFW